MGARWTPEEDSIAKTSPTSRDALHKLPGRTLWGVQVRRRKLQVIGPKRGKRWTKAEDRKIKEHWRESLARLARRFRSRSLISVKARRRALGLGPTTRCPWRASDLKRLERMWPVATRIELIEAFRPHGWAGIKHVAHQNGWRRSNQTEIVTLGNELRDAVRKRAREDGIALRKLEAEIGAGTYFSHPRGCKHEDYNRIARAVEFFGGRLAINWQDE
jgi:hypothetical protein